MNMDYPTTVELDIAVKDGKTKVTPHAEEEALEAAKKLEIEIYTQV
ncbi:MAG: hypothetical protein QXU44_11180 [Candidatus Caldarchaeum sp.]